MDILKREQRKRAKLMIPAAYRIGHCVDIYRSIISMKSWSTVEKINWLKQIKEYCEKLILIVDEAISQYENQRSPNDPAPTANDSSD